MLRNIEIAHTLSGINSPEIIEKVLKGLTDAGATLISIGSDILTDEDKFSVVTKLCVSLGIRIRDAHGPYAPKDNIAYPAESMANSIIALQTKFLRKASSLGCATYSIHLGRSTFNPPVPGTTIELQYELAERALEKLVPEAEKCGTAIAIENLFHPISSTGIITELADKFDSKYLGLCFDSGHANIIEPRPGKKPEDVAENIRNLWPDRTIVMQPDTLATMLPHVITAHLHDNDALADQHELPGKGNVDWKSIRTMLEKAPRLMTIQDESKALRNGCPPSEIVKVFEETGF